MSYGYYHGFLHEIRSAMRAAGVKLLPEQVGPALLGEGAGLLLRNDLESSSEHIILVMEMIHYLLGHHVLYVSEALAEQFIHTEFCLEPECLILPFSVFEVCVGQAFEMSPHRTVPGMLVSFMPDQATIDAVIRFHKESLKQAFFQAAGIDMDKERANRGLPPITCEVSDLRHSIGVRYRGLDRTLYHALFEASDCKDKTIDEVLETLGPVGRGLDKSPQDMSLEEMDCQKKMHRIAFGAMCYLNTVEPEVEKFKDAQRPRYFMPPESRLLGKSVSREEVHSLRVAHWRFLRHEKFKRKEDGGVRVVRVRAANVHYSGRLREKAEDAHSVQ